MKKLCPLTFLRKAVAIILLLALLGGMVLFAVLTACQEYTATAIIGYHETNEEGVPSLNGAPLDPEDILNPLVIAGALTDLQQSAYVEELRARCRVEPIISSEDLTRRNAILSAGEVYEDVPDQYRISLTAATAASAREELDAVLRSYFCYLEQQYGTQLPADVVVSPSDSDAYRLSMVSLQAASMTDLLQAQAEDFPDYRSTRTGFTYAELQSAYELLQEEGIVPLSSATDLSTGGGTSSTDGVIAYSQALTALARETMAEQNAILSARAVSVVSSIRVEQRYQPAVYAVIGMVLVVLCGSFAATAVYHLRRLQAAQCAGEQS